jgi:hypothetical protein
MESAVSEISRAAALLKAMSSPYRLGLLATIADRQAGHNDTSAESLAAELNLSVKSVLKEAIRLQECGLVGFHGHTMYADLTPLSAVADALLAELPVTRLLEQEPDLERFFTNGRLTTLPEDASTRARIAHLLVRLLPMGAAPELALRHERAEDVHDGPARELRRHVAHVVGRRDFDDLHPADPLARYQSEELERLAGQEAAELR